MSFKTNLIRFAIKWTPKALIVWSANLLLKGVARLVDFHFDIDTRKLYAKTFLAGEAEPIEVWLEDFAILEKSGSYHARLGQARSNKLWLNNLLARVVNRHWKLPVPPQYLAQMAMVADVFAPIAATEGKAGNGQAEVRQIARNQE